MTPFQIMMLGGARQTLVDISDVTAYDRQTEGFANAQGTYGLNASGSGYYSNPSGADSTWNWKLMGLTSDYQVRCTPISGTPGGSAINSWLSLGTDRLWYAFRDKSVVGTLLITVLIEIRKISNSLVIDTATVTLRATIAPDGSGGGSA